MKLVIDEEFSQILPHLTELESKVLEESIIRYGCEVPLLIWGDILIDGHARYEICQKHGLPFEVQQISFSSRDEAHNWIIKNQLMRKNIENSEELLEEMLAEDREGGISTSIATQENQLPDTLEDLSKFVLVGREKLNSVRAEIRAIDKLQLAEEVRDQKLEEARMLSEAVLDAEVRLGDLLKKIPKANNSGANQYQSAKATAVSNKQKPKKEVVAELGFSQKQAERFETLANNKDLVEQVKEEARENDDIPTRTRVIDLAQQRKKKAAEELEKEENFDAYLAECRKKADKFVDAIYAFIHVSTDSKSLKMWGELLEPSTVPSLLRETDETIAKLSVIKNYLKGVEK